MDSTLFQVIIGLSPGQSVSRILCAGFPALMTISLGRESPHVSSSLPEAAVHSVQVTSSHLPKGIASA